MRSGALGDGDGSAAGTPTGPACQSRRANLYRSGQGRLRTAAGASRRGRRVPGEIVSEGGARTPRDRPRNTAEKQGRVCRHNGLFLAIPRE
nr:MAG TPA: hypothetical protein [Caudoviricetes sp.]